MYPDTNFRFSQKTSLARKRRSQKYDICGSFIRKNICSGCFLLLMCLLCLSFLLTLECDSPVGLQFNKVRDFLITAQSSTRENPPYKARLNTGNKNENSWCALKNDKFQYLQVCV